MRKIFFILCLTSGLMLHAGNIKLNQIGFYAEEQKYAVVSATDATSFELIDEKTGKSVYSADLTASQTWAQSNETVRIANFTSFIAIGTYRVKVGSNLSAPFTIARKNLFRDLSIYSIKGFYFWRASIAIEKQYAQYKSNNFARALGHPDDKVLVHSSAASTARPTGTVISSPKGWYDAGDYNKYVVNAGIPVFALLTGYSQYSDYYKKLSLNIPESSNNVPDILDEAKWELDWLLTMQDPNDGGVYFKLTNLGFDGMSVMPANAKNTRYVVKKSTTSALDFAAMLAMAARVYKEYETDFPGYSQQCLTAAINAYNWAKANPSITFSNPSDVSTGGYGDNNLSDEFLWAGIELFISTKDIAYLQNATLPTSISLPQWPNVGGLGFISLMQNLNSLPLTEAQKTSIKSTFFSLADNLLYTAQNSPYRIAINSFSWGSNGDASMQGVWLNNAWLFSKDKKYLNAAISSLDYLLGRNAVDNSFVTGFGTKSPMHIHDRRSVADGIVDPIPGYVSGGPNASPASDCGSPAEYKGANAAKWYDADCSYSTNEIAINWNGPFAYLAGAIEAQLSDSRLLPIAATIRSNATVVSLTYSEAITPTSAFDTSFVFTVDGEIITISKVEKDTAANSLAITLSETIKPEYANLTISVKNNKLTSDLGNYLFAVKNYQIMNTVYGAAPIVMKAKILSTGDKIKITCNKKIATVDSLLSGFYINKKDAIIGAAINKTDSSEIILYTTNIKATELIYLSYNGDNLKSIENSAKMYAFDSIAVSNESQINPVQLVGGALQADGYTIMIEASRDIQSTSTEIKGVSLVIDKQIVTPESTTISGKYMILKLAEQLRPQSIIKISYDNGSLRAADGNNVDAVLLLPITNALPLQPAYVISNSSDAKIEATNFEYNNGMVVEVNGADKSLGYIEVGDWVEYTVMIQDTGLYYINGRYASQNSTGKCQYQLLSPNGDLIILATQAVPSTGGWTSWKGYSVAAHLPLGVYKLRLYATGANFNITDFTISKSAAYATDAPEAKVHQTTVSVSPVPTETEKNIAIYVNATIEQRNILVSIISEEGRILQRAQYANAKEVILNESFNAAGIYHVCVTTDNEVVTSRIFVK